MLAPVKTLRELRFAVVTFAEAVFRVTAFALRIFARVVTES